MHHDGLSRLRDTTLLSQWHRVYAQTFNRNIRRYRSCVAPAHKVSHHLGVGTHDWLMGIM